MSYISLILCVLLCSACSSSTPPTAKQETRATNTAPNETSITYEPTQQEAVLIGSNIQLLDQNLHPVQDISSWEGQLVAVTAISTTYESLPTGEGFCDLVKYVQINYQGTEGVVDGRAVYALKENTQTFTVGNNTIAISPTNYFGMGDFWEEDVTDCTLYCPVVFYDKKTNYKGLLSMVKNEFYQANYPYFELQSNEGMQDELTTIEKLEDRYLLHIHRMYQEDQAQLIVAVYQDATGKWLAEIIEQ